MFFLPWRFSSRNFFKDQLFMTRFFAAIMGIFSYSMFEHVRYSEWGIIRFAVAVLTIQGAYALFFVRSWKTLESFAFLRAYTGMRKVVMAIYISKAMTQVLVLTVFVTAFIIADESYLFALAGVLGLMFCLTIETILVRVVFARFRNNTGRISAAVQFFNLSVRNSLAVLCIIIVIYCGESFMEYSSIQADIKRMSQHATVIIEVDNVNDPVSYFPLIIYESESRFACERKS